MSDSLLVIFALMQTAFAFPAKEARIVNGIAINSVEYPWMVYINKLTKLEDKLYESYCGGTLINLDPPIVLTAAHCVQSLDPGTDSLYPQYYSININRTHTRFDGDNYETLYYDYSMLHYHPKFDINDMYNGYDIGLIIFNDNQTVETDIDVLPIWQYSDQLTNKQSCCNDGESFTLIGYGRNGTHGISTPTLEKTTMRYIDKDKCAKNWSSIRNLTDIQSKIFIEEQINLQSIICLLGNDTDGCHGDSGSPAFRIINDKPQIIGVVAFGVDEAGCNYGNIPSAYTSIHHFSDWIQQQIDFYVYDISREPTIDPTINPTISPTNCPECICDDDKHIQEEETWFIVAIVFIILFGLTFIILLYFIYYYCQYIKNYNHGMGKYGKTRSHEVEAGKLNTNS